MPASSISRQPQVFFNKANSVGQVIGAGTFFTIDNDKFIFNQPGVFNFLYIPSTVTTPEVRMQIRMEKYPNRRVDFGLRYVGGKF